MGSEELFNNNNNNKNNKNYTINDIDSSNSEIVNQKKSSLNYYDDFGNNSSYKSSNDLKDLNHDNNEDYTPVLSEKTDYKISFTIVLLSVALLFPYSSYLAVLGYFDVLYPKYHVTSTIPFVYMVMLIFAFLLTLKYTNKVKHHINILGGFLVYIIALIIIPFLSLTDISGTIRSYIISVVLIGISAFVDGGIQSSVFALTALFGSKYCVAGQIGVGLSGVIVVVIRVVIKLCFNNDQDKSNKIGIIIFFCVGCLIIIIASIFFIMLLNSPLGEIIMKTKEEKKEIIVELNDDNENNNFNNNNENGENKNKLSPIHFVWNKTFHYIICLALVMLNTLFIFPGIMMEVDVQDVSKDWYYIIVVAIYNVCDLLGKIVPFFFNINAGLKTIWSITIGRYIFVFLFFMSVYINSFRVDPLIYIFIAIFGFTNGFVASICMAEGPSKVPRQYKELAGSILSFSIDIGLLFGSALSLLVSLVQ